MPDLFTVPPLPVPRDEIPLYRTPVSELDAAWMRAVTRSFGMTGKPEDAGSRTVVKDRTGVLEFFDASGSVWWTRASRARAEPEASVAFLEERQAIAAANDHLKRMGLAEAKAKPVSVTYTEVQVQRKGDRQPSRAVTEQHVNYRFTLDDLPVWGPGAKIQVTLGGRDQVVEVLKFWRATRKDRAPLTPLRPEAALRLLQADEAYAELKPPQAAVRLEEIALGYYALPPREVQGCLIPVYRFRGVASTPVVERYGFTRYVVAVGLTPELLKKSGAVVTSGGPVL